MIQGFETREITDIPIKAFVKSVKGILHQKVKTVEQYQKTEWPTFKSVKDYPCAVFGILRGTADIMKECRKQNQDYYYFDHSYFLGNRHGISSIVNDKVYRITKNNYHVQGIKKLYDDDYERIEKYKDHIDIKDWKYDGDYILVCPPSEHQLKYHNIPNWLNDTVNKIKQHTKRNIKVRPKTSMTPLESDLEKAYACVTFQSVVCLDAVLNGVPSFCDPISMGVAVSETDLSLIEKPLYSPCRLDWIDTLLANQFTLQEIENGTAWRKVQ